MMVSPDQFLRFVLPFANGAAEIAATRYVVEAAHEFCMDTGVWREDLDLVSVRQGQANVDVCVPSDAVLVEIKEVYFDGEKIEPVPPDSAARTFGHNWHEKTSSRSIAYLNPTPETLRLFPIPDVTKRGAVLIKASLAPTVDASSLPKILFDRYARAIANGAISKLLMEPGRLYSDPRKAAIHSDLFENAKPKARKEAQEGFNRARHRTRAVYF